MTTINTQKVLDPKNPNDAPGKNISGVVGRQLYMSNTTEDVYNVLGSNKNMLINGSLDVWQRGTQWVSGSDNAMYTADRWYTRRYAANDYFVIKTTADGLPFENCLRIGRGNGSTSHNDYFINQALEPNVSARCRGKWVTFSFWVRVGPGYTGKGSLVSTICTHNTVGTTTGMYYDNFTIGNASGSKLYTTEANYYKWTRVEHTAFIPLDTVQVGVSVGSGSLPVAALNDYIEVAGLQLEIGSAATPFEYRHYQQELALCQRYYQIVDLRGYPIGMYVGTNAAYSSVPLPVVMRTSPSVTFVNGSDSGYYGYTFYSPSGAGTQLASVYGVNAPANARAVSFQTVTPLHTWTASDGVPHTYIVIRADAEV